MRVERIAQARSAANGFSMSTCATCAMRVHAGIGAPGADDFAAHAGQLLDCVLKRALHARRLRDALPALKRAAVVFERELEAHRDASAAPILQHRAARAQPPAPGAPPVTPSTFIAASPGADGSHTTTNAGVVGAAEALAALRAWSRSRRDRPALAALRPACASKRAQRLAFDLRRRRDRAGDLRLRR